jgi:hypothetical protein
VAPSSVHRTEMVTAVVIDVGRKKPSMSRDAAPSRRQRRAARRRARVAAHPHRHHTMRHEYGGFSQIVARSTA